MKKTCKFRGCNVDSIKNGYCEPHNYGYITYDDPKFRVNTVGNLTCKLEDCDLKHFAKGYCRNHYRKFSSTGNTDGVYEMHHTGCRVKYCRNKHHGKGYCEVHFKRWRRNGDPLKLVRDFKKPRK